MVKEHFKVGFTVIGFVVMCLFGSPSVFASEVTDNLKATIDKVIEIVTDENLKSQKKVRREKLREVIGKRFNFKRMTQKALAKNWKKRTPKEREEFTGLFRKLLEHTYAKDLESYSDEKINFIGESVKGNFAFVKTEIVRKHSTINVDYNMIREKGEWQVYDIRVENVSRMKNFENQFNATIRRKSYDALVQKLSTKIAKVESADVKVESADVKAESADAEAGSGNL